MSSTDALYQRLCVYCGFLFVAMFFLALYMNSMFPPPPSPLMSSSDILANIKDQHTLAKLSVPLGILASGLSIPFNALIAVYIYDIEKAAGHKPILAITSFGGGLINSSFFFLVFFGWAAIIYRDPAGLEATRMIFDITWVIMAMASSAPALQMVVIALASFLDKSEKPVFPRWSGYFMIWLAMGTCTGAGAILFYSGPFAWNGIFGFWLPAGSFLAWMGVLAFLFLKHIKDQRKASVEALAAS